MGSAEYRARFLGNLVATRDLASSDPDAIKLSAAASKVLDALRSDCPDIVALEEVRVLAARDDRTVWVELRLIVTALIEEHFAKQEASTIATLLATQVGFTIDLFGELLAVRNLEDGRHEVTARNSTTGKLDVCEDFESALDAARRFVALRAERRLGHDYDYEVEK